MKKHTKPVKLLYTHVKTDTNTCINIHKRIHVNACEHMQKHTQIHVKKHAKVGKRT